MLYCYLAFRTNVLLNLYCPGHLSYFSPNESEPLNIYTCLIIICLNLFRLTVTPVLLTGYVTIYLCDSEHLEMFSLFCKTHTTVLSSANSNTCMIILFKYCYSKTSMFIKFSFFFLHLPFP